MFPEKVLLEDFQTPLDRDLTEQLTSVEQARVSEFINREVLKPLIDDVNTRQLAVDGIELRLDQVLNLPDCRVTVAGRCPQFCCAIFANIGIGCAQLHVSI